MPPSPHIHPSPSSLPLGVLLLLSVLALWAQLPAQAAAVTASLDRPVISLADSATLTITCEDVEPSSQPQIPSVSGLSIQSVGTQQQFVYSAGRTVVRRSFNFIVRPARTGTFTIPALTLTASGQTYRTDPLTLEVTQKSAVPNEMSFLRLHVPNQPVYLGQPFHFNIQYFIQAMQDVDDLQVPRLNADGFTIVAPQQQHTRGRTQLDGVFYNVITFKMAATPVKAGDLRLGPATMKFSLIVDAQRRGFFGFAREKRAVEIKSEAKTVKVHPLPQAGRPPSFNGAVGDYTMTVQAGPTNLVAGDPITLQIQIAGAGAVQHIPFPPQGDWPHFDLYPVEASVENTDPFGMTGAKRFEQVIIPESTDAREIPAIQFSFFDPNSETYKTQAHPPTPIQVKNAPAGQSAPAISASESEDPSATPELAHIKAYPGRVQAFSSPVVVSPWFWLAQLLPALGWAAVLLYKRRRDRHAKDPAKQRRRRADAMVQRGLQELAHHAKTGQNDAFFATAFRLLQERLGERLSLPASSTTEADIDRIPWAEPSLRAELHELFQICNQARFAPARTEAQLEQLVPRFQSALSSMRS